MAHPSEVGANADEVGIVDADRFDLIITTYEMLVRDDWMKRHSWRLVILDEAQAIKRGQLGRLQAA